MISIPQPPPLMVAAVVEQMKKANVKTAAYIGFSNSWGDLVYDATMKDIAGSPIKVVTNERYARADTSVAGQTFKIIAAHPDAVITGGSGTPGALPYLALAERGYKGGLYGTHALINPDFVRVGGAAVEGVICPTGPVVVAEQLPDSNVTKKVSLAFRDAYQKANNAPTTDAFSAYCVRRLAGAGRCRQARAGEGAARHRRVPRRRSRRRWSPPRKWSAPTASTTSSRTAISASTSAPASW